MDIVDDNNVMAMVAMAQSRQKLAELEHPRQAKEVRQMIIEKFADSSDPTVAEMAAQYAGNVRFDAIDSLVAAVNQGRDVSAKRWREAVEALLDESPDLQTLRYLAGTTIDFESSPQAALADVTFEVLQSRLGDKDSAIGEELKLAIELRDARRSRIGQAFDLSAVQWLGGQPVDPSEIDGKVVLMPFWSVQSKESVMLFRKLQQIADRFPDRVRVIGMNLDSPTMQPADVLQQAGIGLDSFGGQFDASRQPVNPIARQYGMAGMPMTVILDTQGNVASIEFGDRQIESVVQNLVRD